MRKVALVAALLVMATVASAWAAGQPKATCPPANAREAEAAIRYMTDLMVISSQCQDTVYAEFRLRNRDAILGYQKAMIAHLHGNAAFDHWNTSLANAAAQKNGGNQQLCAQSAALLQQAKAMDSNGFRAYAKNQANAGTASCAK